MGAPAIQSPSNVTATLTSTPSATIASGASGALAVEVTPTADGSFGFTLALPSDDPDTASYTIAFTGVAFTPAPEIEVTGAGGAIENGDTQDVGTSLIGSAQTLSFTVTNVGTADLVIRGAEVQNATNVQATLTSQSAGTLAPSMMSGVELSYTPEAEGAFTLDLVVTNDDDAHLHGAERGQRGLEPQRPPGGVADERGERDGDGDGGARLDDRAGGRHDVCARARGHGAGCVQRGGRTAER